MFKRGYGATAARLTPDQKVGRSNLSALNIIDVAAVAKDYRPNPSRGDVLISTRLLSISARAEGLVLGSPMRCAPEFLLALVCAAQPCGAPPGPRASGRTATASRSAPWLM